MSDNEKSLPVKIGEAEDMNSYEAWKQTLQEHEKTPSDVVKHFRECGMAEYAASLERLIQRMEGSLQELA